MKDMRKHVFNNKSTHEHTCRIVQSLYPDKMTMILFRSHVCREAETMVGDGEPMHYKTKRATHLTQTNFVIWLISFAPTSRIWSETHS